MVLEWDVTSFNRLMQFLMGLNDTYNHVRNQILIMDPLPSVNRAYSMVLSVEKQRDVHVVFPEKNENMAMFLRSQVSKKEIGGRGHRRGRTGA